MTASSDSGHSADTYSVDAPTPVQRAWALREAKRLLLSQPFAKVAPYEMVDLANYILTGEDPLQGVEVPERP